MTDCKECGHPIKKRYFIKSGQSIWEWTHKEGGKLCKRTVFGKGLPFGKVCFCCKAEPKKSIGLKGDVGK